MEAPRLFLSLILLAGVVLFPSCNKEYFELKNLSDEELNRIRETIDREYRVEADLRREVTFNIKRLSEIGSYRGLRHRRGLPVRGQRTKTNARTKRGPKKTVAGRGRRRGMSKK